MKLLLLKWSKLSVMNLTHFSMTLFAATLKTLAVCAYIPLEQYKCTKQSWMEDYCKQDKEVNVISSEDWMGSSVDPPCFGQSMLVINHTLFETDLTHRVICLMYYKHKYFDFTEYSDVLDVFGKKKDKKAVFCSVMFNYFKTKSFLGA